MNGLMATLWRRETQLELIPEPAAVLEPNRPREPELSDHGGDVDVQIQRRFSGAAGSRYARRERLEEDVSQRSREGALWVLAPALFFEFL